MRPVVAHASGRPIPETTRPAHLTTDLTPASTVARLEAMTIPLEERSIGAKAGIVLHSMIEPVHDGTTARAPRPTEATGDRQRGVTTAIVLSTALVGTTNGKHGRMTDMRLEANNVALPNRAIATARHLIATSVLKVTTAKKADHLSTMNHAGTAMRVVPVLDPNAHLPSGRVDR